MVKPEPPDLQVQRLYYFTHIVLVCLQLTPCISNKTRFVIKNYTVNENKPSRLGHLKELSTRLNYFSYKTKFLGVPQSIEVYLSKQDYLIQHEPVLRLLETEFT